MIKINMNFEHVENRNKKNFGHIEDWNKEELWLYKRLK